MKRLYGIGILIILILLFFLPPLLKSNSIYAPVDMISMSKPWRDYKSIIPQNFLQGDAELMFVPFREFYYNQMHQHHFPLWNPYIYGGAPFFANDQSSVLSLYNLASLLFPFNKGFLIIAILKLMVTGIGAYLLLDLFGLGIYACLFGSIAWTFSAYMIIYLYHPATAAGSFIPWFFYFFERLVRSMGRQSKFNSFNMFGIAMAAGLSFLAGHAETTAAGILGLLIYAIIRLALTRAYFVKGFIYTISGIIIGILVASIQLFPLVQILANSEPLLYRTYYKDIFFHIYDMILWIVPNIDSNPSYPYLYNYYFNRGSGALPYGAFAYAYIGIAPLLLSMYALLNVRKIGRDSIAFIGVALVTICLIAGIPPFSLLVSLPLFQAGWYVWHFPLAELSLSVLAGFGVQHILNTKVQDKRRSVLLIAVTAGISLFLTFLYLVIRFDVQWIASLIDHVQGIKSVVSSMLARFACFFNSSMCSVLWPGPDPNVKAFFLVQFLTALLFIAGTIFLLIKRKTRPVVVSICLIIFAITDLFTFGINYNPDPSATDLKPITPIIQKLMEFDTKDYTFYAADHLIQPNLNMFYGIRDFRGYDITISMLYQHFLFALFPGTEPLLGNNGGDIRSRPYTPPDPVIASIAGIRYLVFESTTHLNNAYYRFMGSYEDLSLWENPDAKPIIYLAGAVQPVTYNEEALDILSSHDPKLLTTPVVAGVDESGSFDNAKIRLTRIKDRAGEHVVKIDAVSNGFLVINEPYYPGWHAYVDSKEVQMYHVNYLFQGIKIPEGNYIVRIVYSPDMFYIGLVLSLITLGLMIVKMISVLIVHK